MNEDSLAYAMTAAHLGGEVLRRFFGNLGATEVSEKARNDYVSAADHASEEAILNYLSRQTPAVGVLAEERGEEGSKALRWVLDPLDGTTNFVRGFPHFAVSLALVEGLDVLVGVVYDPMRDEMYTATKGKGAFCNGRSLRVTNRPGLAGGLLTTGFPFRVHHLLDLYLDVFRDVFLRVSALRRPGAAALDLAHTAAGIFDAFFEFCLSPWDIAAGALLVREAGGVVTNLDGCDDILSNGSIVAGNPGVHEQLLSVINAHCHQGDIHPGSG